MYYIHEAKAGADLGAYFLVGSIMLVGGGEQAATSEMSGFVLSCIPSAFFIVLQTTVGAV